MFKTKNEVEDMNGFRFVFYFVFYNTSFSSEDKLQALKEYYKDTVRPFRKDKEFYRALNKFMANINSVPTEFILLKEYIESNIIFI